MKSAAQSFAIKFSRTAIIGGDGVILPFENGAKAYANRSFVWENVVAPLTGLKFVQTSGGSSVAREVKVKEPGVVYVAVAASGSVDHEVLKKLGFAKLPMAFNYNDGAKAPMAVFGKLTERSVSLPPASSFSGFVVVGDIR